MHFILPIKKLAFLFLSPVLVILLLPLFINLNVNATDNVEKTLKYTYTFDESKKANVKFETEIDNNNSKNLLKSYVFNISDGAYDGLKAYVNGSETAVHRLSTTTNKFQINFSNDVSKLTSDIKVKVEYNTSSLVDQYGSLLNLYIPYVKKSSQTVDISYSLNYPSIWGSINFASMRGYQISSEKDRTIITIGALSNTNGGYFSIGDTQSFDFKIKYDSITSKLTNSKLALNIPQTSNNQELFFYSELVADSTILVDQYENQFVRYISPEKINLGMQLSKSFGGQKVSSESSWKALYYTDETSQELKKYYSNNFSKVEANKDLAIFDKVTSDYKYSQSEVSSNLPISKILSSTTLNSLEFSVLIANLYNLAGYKARVVGGVYMGGDNIIEIGSNVWFWVEYIGENGLIREIDPTLASATGFDYFTNDGLNHIKIFNYADPLVNLSFSEKLIIPAEYKISAIDKISFETNRKESVVVTNELIKKGKNHLLSGVENWSTFNIKNTSSKVLNISKIIVGTNEVNLNLETNDGYRKLLFPNEEMTFTYPLKQTDWSFSGDKLFAVKVFANLLGEESLIYSDSMLFKYESSELVIIFSWILKLLLSIILVTIIFVSIKMSKKIHRQHKRKHAQIDK
ncbi:MAG: hypothetical protein WCK31_01280 [bacterium]